ncbi:hypothetical protein BS78_01G334900 [Paspalum vaginatum]|nr:hypothetical protein BS78_01G334900 [Paspalum vaginatum]
MALISKSPNSTCEFALIVVLLLASQIVSSHATISSAMIANRRHLSHSADAAASRTKGTMMEGTITPIEGGGASGVPTEDVRPSNPSHSPGIGHAFTNSNGMGRKLLSHSQR